MILQTLSALFRGIIFGFQTNIVPDTTIVEIPPTTIESTDLGLTLILSCQYKASLGRGDTFACHVDEVTQGSLDDTDITLNIPAGAYDGDRLGSIGINSGTVYGETKKKVSFLAHFSAEFEPGDEYNGFMSKEDAVMMWGLRDIQPLPNK